MKTKLKSLLAVALCAVGLSAFAKKPDAVQLWEGGPFFTTCNIGAEKPQDCGYYFWWGDTVGYTNSGSAWVSVDGKGKTISFSNESPANTIYRKEKKVLAGYLDANGNLKSDYDAARAHLGAPWRMMTKEELDKLVNEDYCQRQWVTTYKGVGVSGFVVKGKSGTAYENNEVFFPATGRGLKSDLSYVGSSGSYWSSTPEKTDYLSSSYVLYIIDNPNTFRANNAYRTYGHSVRAVKDPPSVKNVRTATHWPWDGKIDITCDLTGTGTVQLVAALVTNGVKVCDATAANLTGETTFDLDAVREVTNGVRLVWDAKADCPAGFNSKDTKVKVTAEKVLPPPAGQLWKDGPIWAEVNLGATTPEDYGILTNFNDAAQAVTDALGSDWHLPSDGELKMLAGINDGDKVCSNVWTTCNGVAGCRFFGMTSGYEDKSIFLPAAGYDKGSGHKNAGVEGVYWSSTKVSGGAGAFDLCFSQGSGAALPSSALRYCFSIRAVRDAK